MAIGLVCLGDLLLGAHANNRMDIQRKRERLGSSEQEINGCAAMAYFRCLSDRIDFSNGTLYDADQENMVALQIDGTTAEDCQQDRVKLYGSDLKGQTEVSFVIIFFRKRECDAKRLAVDAFFPYDGAFVINAD